MCIIAFSFHLKYFSPLLCGTKSYSFFKENLIEISSNLACTALFVHCCHNPSITGLPPSVCPYSLVSSLKVDFKSTNNLFNFMFYMTSIHSPIKICSFYFTPLKNYFSHSNYLPSQSWSLTQFLVTHIGYARIKIPCALGFCYGFKVWLHDPIRVSQNTLLELLHIGDTSLFFLLVLLSSVTQSCLTPCDPMDCGTPGSPVHHQLPELAQINVRVSDDIQPSYPLPSPSPPTFSLSQHQGLFQRVNSSHEVAKVLELQLQHQCFQWIFITDFL